MTTPITPTAELIIRAEKERRGQIVIGNGIVPPEPRMATRHQSGKHSQKSHGNWASGSSSSYISEASPGIQENAFLGGEDVWDRASVEAVRDGAARVKRVFPNAPDIEAVVKNDKATKDGQAWASVNISIRNRVINVSSKFLGAKDNDVKQGNEFGAFSYNTRSDIIVHEYIHVMESNLNPSTGNDLVDFMHTPIESSAFDGFRYRIGFTDQAATGYGMTTYSEWVAEHGASYVINPESSLEVSKELVAILSNQYGGSVPDITLDEIYTNGEADHLGWEYDESGALISGEV